ncbi:peptidase [Sphingosinicella sp. BN140058]|uniref:peptidase n=1 Tax=Sphingosinicella sp. BN140058 TaxID=1892855 RepID=UPI00101300C1|nr:peptidase [Sphingosinicella sp. BN140058]QAY77241.1 peptidase [Sphingosinicella sp. BN140058]
MTYCLGMLLDEGLVMIADTRTNAGVDNFSSYRKLHCLIDEPERQLFVAAAGNLSITQTVISLIREGLPADEEEGRIARTLGGAASMFRAAQLVGDALQIANRTVGEALNSLKIAGGASLLLGGRIGSGPPSLFLVYEAGNFIECKSELPFFQIGETKYGRPILDRVIRGHTPIAEAVKIGFLSFDSSMRSNLAVARPLDLMVMRADPSSPIQTRRIESNDAYFNDLSARWSDLLHDATRAIPDPPFLTS